MIISYGSKNSAKFWLGLQDDFDIEEEKKMLDGVFEKISLAGKKHLRQKVG